MQFWTASPAGTAQDSFARFSSEHAICFTEANGDWLFPALYDFYTEEVKKPSIIELLQELGMLFHNDLC